MLDATGLTTETKKWNNSFEDKVEGTIILISLANYDHEDFKYELLRVNSFEKNTHSSTVIIFFTNKDIFEKKIKSLPINKFFPSFDGNGSDYDESTNFIQNYVKNLFSIDCQPYFHYLNLFDVNNIRHVMNAVKDIGYRCTCMITIF